MEAAAMSYRAFPVVPSDRDIPAGLLPDDVDYHEGMAFPSEQEAREWASRVESRFPDVAYVEVRPEV
jgi:hypothetical protein